MGDADSAGSGRDYVAADPCGPTGTSVTSPRLDMTERLGPLMVAERHDGTVRRRIDDCFEAAGCTGALHVHRLSDGAEVACRADDIWLAASVIKVVIGLEFYAQTDDGLLDPTQPVLLRAALRTPGPTGISMAEDDATMSLRDLCAAMLTVSDNAATDAILDVVGVGAVNERLAGC